MQTPSEASFQRGQILDGVCNILRRVTVLIAQFAAYSTTTIHSECFYVLSIIFAVLARIDRVLAVLFGSAPLLTIIPICTLF